VRQNSAANTEASQLQSGREVNHRPLLLVTSTAAPIHAEGNQLLAQSLFKQAPKRSGASMAVNANLLSVSSNDKTVVVEQNSSKPHSANLKISIPARQRKESFESECSTVDSCHMSVSDDLNTSSIHEMPALSPRSRLSRGLVSDYVCSIDSYHRKIEKDSQLKPDHLAHH